ncbi:hypothetical protein J437_LFUL012659 [Ladona fulva]|uniref:Ferritin n=1 Tax=Ladona fulva TaxID=123851 RepID=A0A8K0KDE5_LADFU|nr:hypothetical protein J437_LFUL012659 [Ladona fulva]
MKTVLALFLVATAMTFEIVSSHPPPGNVPTDWITMTDPCIQKMKDQVQEEIKAAMTYLTMGAHFSRDVVNRPGFAKFFFESASEEREHAIKIMSYLLMRVLVDTWSDGLTALTQALNLETHVTNKIRDVIKVCEEARKTNNEVFNDYHLVDYLSGDFLEEQYKGQRQLAGMISTLGKMNQTHKSLGEFLFDKKLLNGEPL